MKKWVSLGTVVSLFALATLSGSALSGQDHQGSAGAGLVRSFELSGNRLVVKSSSANEHWRVTWEHY